jgi:hypothetical protein
MADNVTGLFKRGQTYNGPNKTLSSSYGQSVGIEGNIRQFTDYTKPTSAGVVTKRSDRLQTAMVVRNTSGVNLLPKRLVKWATGYRGRRVDGYCNVDNEEVAGVVDELLPSTGVRNYDLFWLQVGGPAMCTTAMEADAHNVISEGSALLAQTAAASTAATTSGRVQPLVASTHATQAVAQMLGIFGKAMSAKTTANTNVDILVDLTLLKT